MQRNFWIDFSFIRWNCSVFHSFSRNRMLSSSAIKNGNEYAHVLHASVRMNGIKHSIHSHTYIRREMQIKVLEFTNIYLLRMETRNQKKHHNFAIVFSSSSLFFLLAECIYVFNQERKKERSEYELTLEIAAAHHSIPYNIQKHAHTRIFEYHRSAFSLFVFFFFFSCVRLLLLQLKYVFTKRLHI